MPMACVLLKLRRRRQLDRNQWSSVSDEQKKSIDMNEFPEPVEVPGVAWGEESAGPEYGNPSARSGLRHLRRDGFNQQ